MGKKRNDLTTIKFMLLFLIVMVTIVFVSLQSPAGALVRTQDAGGSGGTTSTISANSCNADASCETNAIAASQGITANGPIIMGSPDWYIWSNGYLGVDKYALVGGASSEGVSNGLIRTTGPIEGKSLSVNGGAIIMAEPNWYIWSNGYMGVDKFILVGGASSAGWSTGLINTTGPVVADSLNIIHTATVGKVVVTTLAGSGTAYACISISGQIIRSQTPCV